MKNGNLLPMVLVIAVLVSAVFVVQFKYQNQNLTNRKNELLHEQQRLEIEWAQLQIEKATLSQRSWVDQLARSQFGMVEPAQSVIVEAPSAAATGADK